MTLFIGGLYSKRFFIAGWVEARNKKPFPRVGLESGMKVEQVASITNLSLEIVQSLTINNW